MKGLIKKSIGITMAVVMLVITGMSNMRTVNAADKEFGSTEVGTEDKFSVSYDSSKYNIYWVSRKVIKCRSQHGSMWSNLDKGNLLGTATIKVYYLEPRGPVGYSYYATAGCQVSMNPVDLKGNVTGMAQMADFGIKTPNEDSRICSPTVNMLEIQASMSSSTSNSFTAGTGIKYNSNTGKMEPSIELNYGKTWGSSSTYNYNRTNVNLTQKSNNRGYASWCYDYKSRNKDVTWNAYLMSSSKVAGQVAYRLIGKPTVAKRAGNVPSKICYDIRFGAGNKATGKVANRFGPSTNRDMCIETGSFTMSY